MSSENIAAVLLSAKELKINKIREPHPQENDVVITMGPVGICGSDIKYWQYGKCGRFTVTEPMVLGHEAAGTVLSVGSKVKHLKPGDRVAIEPGVPCRQCIQCKTGRYNLCADIRFCATPPVDGSICRRYVHDSDYCFQLPDHVSLEEGALLEPLAVAVYSLQRATLPPAANLLICGAGPVGLLTMMAGRAFGVDQVIVTDIDDSRLKLAKELGASHVVNVSGHTEEAMATLIKETYSAPHAAIECSGSDYSMRLGILACRQGGSVVLVGRGSMEPTVCLVHAAINEIDIKGVFRYANCYPSALSLIASGRVNAKKLITHHFTLEETEKAFQTAADRNSGAIKVMIHCNQ